MPAAVEIVDLVKTYGSLRAVDRVSFTVSAGEIVGLLGPNGAGKTSTLECLLGLRAPDSGAIHVDGSDDASITRRRLGAVLQSTALQDKITPREAARLFGRFYGINRKTSEMLERFALTDKADATFDSLSGGQRQRLALALAFVHRPSVMVLDEPTAGLDPPSRRMLHDQIRSLQQQGCAVLLSTHYIDEAHALCDRVVILNQGRVVVQGSPAELVAGSKGRVIVRTRPAIPLDQWMALSLARSVEDDVIIETSDITRTVLGVTRLLESLNAELVDLQIRRPTLEDIFLEKTGSTFTSNVRSGRLSDSSVSPPLCEGD